MSPPDKRKIRAKMHYAEGMLQSGVGCPGINLVCQAELTDAPQSLECRVIDNLLFPAVKRNKSMDRITDYEIWQTRCLQDSWDCC